MPASEEEYAKALKTLYTMKGDLIKLIAVSGVEGLAMSTLANLASIQKCIETLEESE